MTGMNASAWLCDYADVSGGKLFVSGAGIGVVGSPLPLPPLPVNICLAIMVTIPWTATNAEHTMTVELVSDAEGAGGTVERVALADGLPPGHDPADLGKVVIQFHAGRGEGMVPGEDTLMPVALPLYGLPLPRAGGYFFSLAIDGPEVSRVSFRAVQIDPATGQPALGS